MIDFVVPGAGTIAFVLGQAWSSVMHGLATGVLASFELLGLPVDGSRVGTVTAIRLCRTALLTATRQRCLAFVAAAVNPLRSHADRNPPSCDNPWPSHGDQIASEIPVARWIDALAGLSFERMHSVRAMKAAECIAPCRS